MKGNTVLTSAWMVICLACVVTFPQEIASATGAPLRLPSHSDAVVIYTA